MAQAIAAKIPTRLVKMAKCLPFLTCLKSLLQQIINSILRKSVMNTQLSLLCVCSMRRTNREIAKMLAERDLTEAARQQAEQLLKR